MEERREREREKKKRQRKILHMCQILIIYEIYFYPLMQIMLNGLFLFLFLGFILLLVYNFFLFRCVFYIFTTD